MYKIIITYSEKYGAICECWYNGDSKKSFILTESSNLKNINGFKCLNYDFLFPILQSIHTKHELNHLLDNGLEIKMEDLPKELRINKKTDKIVIQFRRVTKSQKNELLKITNIKNSKIANIENSKIPLGLSATSLLLIVTMAVSCMGDNLKEITNNDGNPITVSDSAIPNSDKNISTEESIHATSINLSYLLDRENDNYPDYIKSVLSQVDKNGQTCEQIIEKYSTQFGIDKRLIIAIACQESRIGHNPNDTGSAIGQMQIEKAVWIGKTIESTDIYGNTISEYITEKKLKELDFNIKTGCMIFNNYKNMTDYHNLPLALACYNMGPGTMCKITGEEKLKNINPQDLSWIETMEEANTGDPKYIKHIMEWLIHLGLDEPYALITNNGETIHISFCLEKIKSQSLG